MKSETATASKEESTAQRLPDHTLSTINMTNSQMKTGKDVFNSSLSYEKHSIDSLAQPSLLPLKSKQF